MGGIKGQAKNSWKNEANIETFINMLVLGCSVPEVVDAIGFKRPTYYQWLDDANIMKEVDKRRHIVHTEGQAFIRSRYKKYLSNIDTLCSDMTDKRTCLSANQYMVDRVDGKAGSSIDVTVAEVNDTNDITSAKDLLAKYNKQLSDLSADTTEDEVEEE